MLNESSTNNAQSEIPAVSQSNSNQVSKPEAIVRPQRRRELSQERTIDCDRDDVDLGDKNQKENAKENVKKLFPRRPIFRDSKKGSRDGSSSSSHDEFNKRPLFVTTVPRGVFLPPPCMREPTTAKNRIAFTFASRPRVLLPQLQKQLSEQNDDRPKENPAFQNFERRIARGAAYNCLHAAVGENDYIKREEEAKRRQILRKRQIARNQRGIIGTPPMRGRKHETIQTDRYLEEIFRETSEREMCCQTDLQDLFLHRPVTAVHIPSKIGVDASTEILDGELFDFDAEVQPILNNLIGKTLQQALDEVVQEEEIADLREQQQRILAMHEKELAELRRLEQVDHTDLNERSNSMQERITAAKLLQGHIAELLPNVLESIESLRDADNKEDLQKKLTPWLAEEVATEIGQMIDSRELLLEIVKEVLQHRAEVYSKLEDDGSEM